MAKPSSFFSLNQSRYPTRVEISSDVVALVQSRDSLDSHEPQDVVILSQADAIELANAILAQREQEAA